MMKTLFAKKEKEIVEKKQHNEPSSYPRKRTPSLNEIEDFFMEKEEKLKGLQLTFQLTKKYE